MDAAGAAMGSIGLIAFALVLWRFLPQHSPGLVLGAATIIWFTVSVLVWQGRKIVPIHMIRG